MYTIHKAKTMLSQLVKEAVSGKEVIICRGNLPVAKLVPIKPPKHRRPGTLKGRLIGKRGAFDPLNAKDLKMWGMD